MEKMAFGVDLGWVSQLESRGFSWVDEEGRPIDPIRAAHSMGADSVRLRVFVSPPKDGFWQKNETERCMLGFCDPAGVLETARRVQKLGMRLMIDFHYSDHFADPLYQDIPKEWKKEDAGRLAGCVAEHTKDVLTLLKENDIFPEWVQVGNEIDPGMLLPEGSIKENPGQLVSFLNAGYDAVRSCMPDARVITHLNYFCGREKVLHFFDTFFALGGKTDILGFSHYPYWFKIGSGVEDLFPYLEEYQKRYRKPVMICEVGGPETEEEDTCRLLENTIEALRALPDGQGLGLFYWEPEAASAVLPDHYPLGAARLLDEHTLQYTGALKAYKKYNQA